MPHPFSGGVVSPGGAGCCWTFLKRLGTLFEGGRCQVCSHARFSDFHSQSSSETAAITTIDADLSILQSLAKTSFSSWCSYGDSTSPNPGSDKAGGPALDCQHSCGMLFGPVLAYSCPKNARRCLISSHSDARLASQIPESRFLRKCGQSATSLPAAVQAQVYRLDSLASAGSSLADKF